MRRSVLVLLALLPNCGTRPLEIDSACVVGAPTTMPPYAFKLQVTNGGSDTVWTQLNLDNGCAVMDPELTSCASGFMRPLPYWDCFPLPLCDGSDPGGACGSGCASGGERWDAGKTSFVSLSGMVYEAGLRGDGTPCRRREPLPAGRYRFRARVYDDWPGLLPSGAVAQPSRWAAVDFALPVAGPVVLDLAQQ